MQAENGGMSSFFGCPFAGEKVPRSMDGIDLDIERCFEKVE